MAIFNFNVGDVNTVINMFDQKLVKLPQGVDQKSLKGYRKAQELRKDWRIIK